MNRRFREDGILWQLPDRPAEHRIIRPSVILLWRAAESQEYCYEISDDPDDTSLSEISFTDEENEMPLYSHMFSIWT